MAPPKVSIILPVFNGAEHIQEALDCVLASRFQDFEVLVINDASTDATSETLSAYRDSRVRVLNQPRNLGVSAARNRGAEIAQSDLLFFLDADVLIPPDLLDKVWNFMKTHPDIAGCQGRYAAKSYYPDVFSAYKNLIQAFRGFETKNGKIHYIHTACAAIRKDIFMQFKFNEKLRRREDIDLGLRLFKAGHVIQSLDSLEVMHKKKYGFQGFSRYQFLSAQEMTLDHFRAEKNLLEETVSRTQEIYKKLWLLRPVLAMASLAAPALGFDYLLGLIVLSFLLEAQFRLFLFKNAPLSMSFYAIGLYFYDGLLCAAGIFSAILKAKTQNIAALSRKTQKFSRAMFNQGLPSSLIYFVTNICNLKCEHCFYWQQLNTEVEDLTLKELSTISRSLGWLNNLSLSGGEPFIRKDLAEVLHIFYRNNGLKFTLIPTNGFYKEKTLQTLDKIKKLCPDLAVTIQVSLDGTREVHDRIRGIPSSFDKAMETLDALLPLRRIYSDLDVVTNTVLHSQNFDDGLALYQFLKDKFPDLHAGLSLYRGGGFGDLNPPAPSEWQKVIDLLKTQSDGEKESGAIRKIFHQMRTEYVDHLNLRAIEGKVTPFDCSAGDKIAVLDHNGDVKVCENHKPIANLRDYDFNFKKLWESEPAKRMRGLVKGCFCNHPCFLQNSTSYYPSNHLRIAAHALGEKWGLPPQEGGKTHYLELQKTSP